MTHPFRPVRYSDKCAHDDFNTHVNAICFLTVDSTVTPATMNSQRSSNDKDGSDNIFFYNESQCPAGHYLAQGESLDYFLFLLKRYHLG